MIERNQIIDNLKENHRKYNGLKVHIRTAHLALQEEYRYLRVFRTLTYLLNKKRSHQLNFENRNKVDNLINEFKTKNSSKYIHPTTIEIETFILDDHRFNPINMNKINMCVDNISEIRKEISEYNELIISTKNRIKNLQRRL